LEGTGPLDPSRAHPPPAGIGASIAAAASQHLSPGGLYRLTIVRVLAPYFTGVISWWARWI